MVRHLRHHMICSNNKNWFQVIWETTLEDSTRVCYFLILSVVQSIIICTFCSFISNGYHVRGILLYICGHSHQIWSNFCTRVTVWLYSRKANIEGNLICVMQFHYRHSKELHATNKDSMHIIQYTLWQTVAKAIIQQTWYIRYKLKRITGTKNVNKIQLLVTAR